MRLLTTGEASRELGISVEWLRKLERQGRIPKARRMLNGRRVYTFEDVEHIRDTLIPFQWQAGDTERASGKEESRA